MAIEKNGHDLAAIFERVLTGTAEPQFDEIGIVAQVGDTICRVYGLSHALYGEMVEFERGNRGMVLGLDESFAAVFLLYTDIPVDEHEIVRRTGNLCTIPVGDQLLGRVIDVRGRPLDGLGPLAARETRPIEHIAPGVIERLPINESLETGILAIDALVPIGKGQRELIIGNRNTGKTTVALDTIMHQKGRNVTCVYVSIGQRQANIARIIAMLAAHGALEYTVIVAAESAEAVLAQYIAPYVGCTIAEYFRDQKRDVLIVYDDLSNHAIAYREMSLLLRRAPGREAYPGDVFYLHSRLLERAGKLSTGGSMTALPIVHIQSDDITAYIPTNLISITDGQIFLDTQLFNQGIRPAINIELSVSRVGGAAQTKAMKKMTKAMRLELAQYHELLDFAQFGTELDQISQRRLSRGEIVVELLKQQPHVTYTFVDQVIMLFALRYNFLDTIKKSTISLCVSQLISFVLSVYPELYKTIESSQDLSDETIQRLYGVVQEFMIIFGGTQTQDK